MNGDYKLHCKLLEDPEMLKYNDKQVCYYPVIDSNINVDDLDEYELLRNTLHVFEPSAHGVYSMQYLEKDSICSVEGDFGTVQAVDNQGEVYQKQCLKATRVEFKSFPKKLREQFNQSLFDHFKNK